MIPEWLFDLDTPGHYLRRIKSVSVSIPSVVGPYTSINCKLTLLESHVRHESSLKDENRYLHLRQAMGSPPMTIDLPITLAPRKPLLPAPEQRQRAVRDPVAR